MADQQQSDTCAQNNQPGKTRTWWHPLLARMLDFVLASAFKVMEEVLVGKMPLRVDILLVCREGGELSEAKRQELSALVPLLNRFTLIEFKGPTDVIARGDFAQLLACSFLWHSQEHELIPHDEVSLIVLAPTVSGALRDELRALGFEASQHEPGIFRVTGLPFAAWLVETDVMAERGQPVLSLVSRVFLNDRGSIMDELKDAGHDALVDYMVQQIQQFRSEKGFAMQHAQCENMEQLHEELLSKIMAWAPVEQRLRGLPAEERMRGLPPEERLRGLPAEERVRGLSLEERLAGLTEEEAARLRELLERKQDR